MLKLKAKGLKWLKSFHLLAVCCWVGGAVSLIMLYFIKNGVTNGGVLHGINQSIHQVDMAVVVIPGALGCLLTGLIYSMFSSWGFFKHSWITLKWIITIGAILFGTFYLGPWETAMTEVSGRIGIEALNNPVYQRSESMNLIFGSAQVLILIVTIFISVFKPLKKTKIKG